jgi:hypothetical protein
MRLFLCWAWFCRGDAGHQGQPAGGARLWGKGDVALGSGAEEETHGRLLLQVALTEGGRADAGAEPSGLQGARHKEGGAPHGGLRGLGKAGP